MEGTAMSELPMQTISLADIKGAEYNPRFLSEEKFQKLRASIRELGIIKPLLVRIENKTTIAGHQRTKAMRAEGINTSRPTSSGISITPTRCASTSCTTPAKWKCRPRPRKCA